MNPKFRAWDIKRKKFVEILHLSHDENGIFSILATHDGKMDTPYFMEEIELIQFTGLTDKNGEELFEGDIVKFRNGIGESYIGVVKFNDGCFDIEAHNTRYGILRDYLKVYVVNHAVEIIGNRFENPELLKE